MTLISKPNPNKRKMQKMLNQAQITSRLLAAAEAMESVQASSFAFDQAEVAAGRTTLVTSRQQDFYRAAQAAVLAHCLGE